MRAWSAIRMAKHPANGQDENGVRRVLFVLTTLNAGGAEHQALALLHGLRDSGVHVDLAVLDKRGALVAHLSSDYAATDLGKRTRWHLIGVIRRLRRIVRISRPDVVVSFLPLANCVAALATVGLPVHLIANEMTNLTAYFKSERFGRAWELLLPYLYRRVSRIVTNTNLAANYCVNRIRIDRSRVRVHATSVDCDLVRRLASAEVSHLWFQRGQLPIILGFGRLSPEKGFARLIQSFALIRQRLPSRLVLLGDGPQRSALETQATTLKVSEDVAFLGFQENPFSYLSRATVLAIPSAFEGLPTVALEAMACGTPVIGFRGVGGLDEIADQGRTVFLVVEPTPAAFGEALLRVIGNVELRRSMVNAGLSKVNEFTRGTAIRAYIALIEDTVNERFVPFA